MTEFRKFVPGHRLESLEVVYSHVGNRGFSHGEIVVTPTGEAYKIVDKIRILKTANEPEELILIVAPIALRCKGSAGEKGTLDGSMYVD